MRILNYNFFLLYGFVCVPISRPAYAITRTFTMATLKEMSRSKGRVHLWKSANKVKDWLVSVLRWRWIRFSLHYSNKLIESLQVHCMSSPFVLKLDLWAVSLSFSSHFCTVALHVHVTLRRIKCCYHHADKRLSSFLFNFHHSLAFFSIWQLHHFPLLVFDCALIFRNLLNHLLQRCRRVFVWNKSSDISNKDKHCERRS